MCPSGGFSLFMTVLVGPASLIPSPWYARRLDWFAIADDIDSPLAVTSAESVIGSVASIEAGLDASLLHGPGESPDMRGDGRGVTSDIAFSIGEDTTEFGAELRLVLLPKAPAKAFLILGVRGTQMVFGAGCNSTGLGTGVIALAAVTVYPGMSVRIRKLGLRGLECEPEEPWGGWS
jgi:hypothetical protein